MRVVECYTYEELSPEAKMVAIKEAGKKYAEQIHSTEVELNIEDTNSAFSAMPVIKNEALYTTPPFFGTDSYGNWAIDSSTHLFCDEIARLITCTDPSHFMVSDGYAVFCSAASVWNDAIKRIYDKLKTNFHPDECGEDDDFTDWAADFLDQALREMVDTLNKESNPLDDPYMNDCWAEDEYYVQEIECWFEEDGCEFTIDGEPLF